MLLEYYPKKKTPHFKMVFNWEYGIESELKGFGFSIQGTI